MCILQEDALAKGADYSISTFGFGPHQCPGKKFAVLAGKTIVAALLDAFTLEPQWESVRVIPKTIGAVGRPVSPALLGYKRRG
jgi:cytochrome P450